MQERQVVGFTYPNAAYLVVIVLGKEQAEQRCN
jgi:hypothetical protein